MSTTTYGDISPRTAAYAATQMLRHAEPTLVLARFGQTKPLPGNKSKTIKFRRPKPFSAATTPLVEGVTPTAGKIEYEDIEVTVQQYGDVRGITDVIIDTHEDPVLQDMVQLSGEQAGLTMEMVTYGVLKAGTNVFYANGASRSAVNTTISLAKQRAVTRFLKRMKAMKITSVLAPGPAYGTSAIEAAYVAVAHTDLESSIRALPGFVPTAKYASRQPVCAEEIGSVEDVRYILSPELAPWTDAGGAYAGSSTAMVSTSGTSADVYPVLFFGKEAFGIVPLKGKNAITPAVVNPKPVIGDPLGQRGTVGWKAWHAAVILNQTWMARLEVAVEAL